MAKRNLFYLINDKQVPSVTTVLDIINKPELWDWYKREGFYKCEKIKEAAAEFGSQVHGAIEAIIDHEQVPHFTDERLETTLNNFQAWAKANILEWVGFEKAVYHDELGYAGTVDAFAKLKNGKLVLVDFKTSKKVRWEYYLQVAAYLNATRVEDDVVDLNDVKGAIIVHLDHASLTWEAVNVPMTGLFDIFKAALLIYKSRPKGG